MIAKPRLRAATRADLPRIALIRHGTTENRLSDPDRVSDGEVLWYLDEAIFLVSEGDQDVQGKAVQGFVCANHQTGLVWALFVDESARGRGHGTALLEAALERLKAMCHAQAFLETDADSRAVAFYEARGWRLRGMNSEGEAVLTLPL